MAITLTAGTAPGTAGASSIARITTTGDITTVTAYLRGVSVTAGPDAATATVRAGGSGGTVILTIKVTTTPTVFVPLDSVLCAGGIHVTLTGTTPECSVIYA